MRFNLHLTLSGAFLASVLVCLSQTLPPPNDDYTNRIVLSGQDITFTGSLAGATWEWGRNEPLHYDMLSRQPTQSVWWEWTTTVPTTAIVEILNPSADATGVDQVEVWTIDYPGVDGLLHSQWIGGMIISSNWPYWYFSFPAYPGTNYEIQLAGSDSATISMRLVTTSVAWFIEQPKSQTVTAGDSVLFTALAAGQTPFNYQWQFNGTNLPGETVAMLALDQVTVAQAGQYQVWITNAGGATVSDVANLAVTPTDTSPLLSTMPAGSNQFGFAVLGAFGRRYRLQSSTNLLDWSVETSFPSFFYESTAGSRLRSVVFAATGTNSFGVPLAGGQKFFRAAPFHATNEACNNNLKQIRFAQVLYCYDTGRSFQMAVSKVNLMPYLKNGLFPKCPSGTNYEVFAADWNPHCLTGLHPFEEP